MARLDETLERQVQRTGSNTGRLRTDAERAAFSTNVRADLAVIMHQWNEVAYPLFQVLSSTDTLNAIELGLSGNAVFSHILSTSASSPIFWDNSLSRQRTIKESFDYTVSELARLEGLIVTNIDIDGYDDGQLKADIAQLDLNLSQLRKDTMGLNYTFDNDGNPDLTYSLSQAIDAIGGKFTGFPGTGNTYTSTYPALTLTVKLSEIIYDITIPQAGITNLPTDLNAIRNFIGKDTSGAELTNYSAHGPISHVTNGLSLEEAVQVLDQAIPASVPQYWDLSAGSLTNNGSSSTIATDDFIVGSISTEDSGPSYDSRLFFDKSLGAFRAGSASSTQWDAVARGQNSVAMGADTMASGQYSTVSGGFSNIVYTLAVSSTIGGGESNTVFAEYCIIGGGVQNIAGSSGFETTTNYATIIGGQSNEARSQWSVIGGGLNNHTGDALDDTVGKYAAITGGQDNLAQGQHDFVGGGYNNQSLSNNGYNTIGGGNSNTISDGTANFIGGGLSGEIPSGNYIVLVGGQGNIARGDHTAVLSGHNNEAQGLGALIVAGAENAMGSLSNYSTIINGDLHRIAQSVTSNWTTILGGRAGDGRHTGEYVFATARDDASATYRGETQTSFVQWAGETVGVGPHELFLDALSEQLVLPDLTTYYFEIRVGARRYNAADQDADYTVTGAIHRHTGAASATMLWSNVVTNYEDDAAWGVAVSADATTGALKLDVTGSATGNVIWIAHGTIRRVTVQS